MQNQYCETLACINFEEFADKWEKNSTLQIEFSATNDGSLAFALLQTENSILFNGQEYIIKQAQRSHENYNDSITVTATHVYFESKRIRVYTENTGSKTYKIQDILHMFFDNNKYGFSWEVIGDFNSVEIENLGNTSALDVLNSCVEKFNCVIYPDNRDIKIYSIDKWRKPVNKSYLYGNNTTTFSVSWDTTSIQNVAMCYGKQKDDESNSYYFQPFLAKAQDSINRWGERPGDDISDERFTDKNSMNEYALKSMQVDPLTEMSLTYDGEDEVLPGEVWYLRVEAEKFDTDVEVASLTRYPFNKSHAPEITLNNSPKTLIDEEVAQDRQVKDAIKNNSEVNIKISNINKSVNDLSNYKWTGDDVNDYYS